MKEMQSLDSFISFCYLFKIIAFTICDKAMY